MSILSPNSFSCTPKHWCLPKIFWKFLEESNHLHMAGLLSLVNWLCNPVWANGLVFMHVGLYPNSGCWSGACVSPSRSRLCYLNGAPLWPQSGLYFWHLIYIPVSSNIYFFTFKSQIINLETLHCEIHSCTPWCSDQQGLFTYSHPDRTWNVFSQWYSWCNISSTAPFADLKDLKGFSRRD